MGGPLSLSRSKAHAHQARNLSLRMHLGRRSREKEDLRRGPFEFTLFQWSTFLSLIKRKNYRTSIFFSYLQVKIKSIVIENWVTAASVI